MLEYRAFKLSGVETLMSKLDKVSTAEACEHANAIQEAENLNLRQINTVALPTTVLCATRLFHGFTV